MKMTPEEKKKRKNERNRLWRKRHPNYHKEYQKIYYLENSEKIKQQNRERYRKKKKPPVVKISREEYLEKARIANAKWRAKNREYWKEYAKMNPEKSKEANKRWRKKYPEKVYRKNSEAHKKYYLENRERILANQKRYTEKKKLQAVISQDLTP